MAKFEIKHGMYGTPTYKSWQKMKERCLNPKSNRYENYGERGITVCDRWMTFENFLADMGVRPAGMTIERIHNDKGYEPGNCRWATDSEQARNRRSTRLITINGETKCASDWADLQGIKACTLIARIDDSGMTPEEAIKHQKYAHKRKRDYSKTNFAKGERNPRCALTEKQVVAIIENKEGLKQIDLARKYGVSATVISGIQRGITWKHVPRNTKTMESSSY